ncbi:MAG: ATP-binding protein [Methyloligellaceae bacterium]
MSVAKTPDRTAKRSTIRRKLVAVVLVGIATTTFLITLASGWREATRYADAKRAEIEGTASVLASAVADALSQRNRVGALKALRAIGRIPSFAYARVDDINGKTIAALGATVALNESADLPILLRSTLETRVPVVREGRPIGHVTVLVNTGDLRRRLLESSLTGLLAALVSAALGVAIAFRMQERITAPLSQLTATMSEIRQTHDFSTLVDNRANDETGVLVDAFNDMMVQIQQRDDRLTEHREQLEQKVEERTIDLRAAKDAAEGANAAKSDFLATMSHEIRTPMNGMLVMAELLASANLTDRHRRYADVIVKSGQSLLSIINDILDFSKIESGKLEIESVWLDPAEVVDDVLSLFWERAATKDVDLAAYVAANVPDRIKGDAVRLNQILSNLVNNALKFTEAGHVTVTVRRQPRTDSSDVVGIEFSVTDTGIGIPKEKLETIFESFAQADQSTTRRFGGTGLGLAICRRLVEAMAGTIDVSSTVGEGSVFRFVMRAEAEAAPAEAAPAARTPLTRAIVALDGPATSKVVRAYLGDRRIPAVEVASDDLSAETVSNADVLFCEPDIIGRLSPGADAGGATPRPIVICVSQMGDVRSDGVIEAGEAQDLLMRPVSRGAIAELIDRLEAGTPLGRAALQQRTAARLPSYSGVRVLVADDSPVNREVVIEALKQLDVRADVVEDGRAAIEATLAEAYDLILMDCSMPDVDGFEATRRIRAEEQSSDRDRIPIVALTAHIAGGPADEWQRAGMDDIMSKPFRITDLVALLDRFVGRQDGMEGQNEDGDERISQPAAADPASDAPVPIIDESVLQMIAGMPGSDGVAFLTRIFSLFETHAPKALLTLAESARDSGNGDIADAAHALKSMARNVGAMRLGAACDRLESQARSGHVEHLTRQLAGVQGELLAVLEQIKAMNPETARASGA